MFLAVSPSLFLSVAFMLGESDSRTNIVFGVRFVAADQFRRGTISRTCLQHRRAMFVVPKTNSIPRPDVESYLSFSVDLQQYPAISKRSFERIVWPLSILYWWQARAE